MFGMFRPPQPPEDGDAHVLTGPEVGSVLQHMAAQAEWQRQQQDANARMVALNYGMALANGDPDRALKAARTFHAFLTGRESGADVIPLSEVR